MKKYNSNFHSSENKDVYKRQIMLTAKRDERDELMGFDGGVDEYISKPFSPKIRVARVEAILRRSGHGEQEDRCV